MKRLTGTSYTLISIMLLTVVATVFALQLHYFASRILPIIYSGIVFALSGVALWREISKNRNQSSRTSSGIGNDCEALGTAKFHEFLPFTLWTIGFSLGIYLLGFTISMALFVLAYMKTHGSSWWGSLVVAIVFAGIIHVVFNILLQSDLYRGLIPLYFDIKF